MGFDIDKETIERVAKISRLRLTPEEEERLLSDFKEILSAFSMLDEAEADCEPAFHPIDIKNYLREDEASIDVPPEEIVEDMNMHQGFIKGPRMQ